MKLKTIILLILIPVLTLNFSNSAKAANQGFSGYIYSETAGWISLDCANTNSCSSVDYKISKDGNGKLSGYGYSQNGEWINFNPNFGGANIDSDSTLSGWVYGQTSGWINFDSAKIISANDLQKDITSAKDVVNSNDLSDASTMSLLNSLCGKFLTNSECNMLNQ